MNIQYEDIDSDEPASKRDLEQLREDLQRDMSNLASRLRDEIGEQTEGLLDRVLKEMASTESRHGKHLDDWGRQLYEKIDVAVESRQIDLGAAKSEHVELNSERLDRHEGRIRALERDSGMPTDF
ncbi:MAG: hypothetical protein DWQ34_28160 [Planctomycetota bacterium]|nr:MAG: hypothetical protein DWQ34_28160 [Planctomycetota bacterium]